MVDIQKLRSRMVLKGYTQKTLSAAIRSKGIKMSENTLSSKMTGASQFDCADADAICEILELVSPEQKAEIFLA